MIEGGAYGLACNLALACDLTVVATTPSCARCSPSSTCRSTAAAPGSLPRIVGLKAKELALLAEKLPAAEAERLGLVNCVGVQPAARDRVKESDVAPLRRVSHRPVADQDDAQRRLRPVVRAGDRGGVPRETTNAVAGSRPPSSERSGKKGS